MLPDSFITIKKNFHWSVIVQCFVIQDALTATKSKIHLICDAWISSNSYIIWGMQAIFFDSKYCKQDFLISLEQFCSNYRGKMQTGVTFQVANEYGITKNLKYVVMDNALLNNILTHTMEFILGE